MGTSVDNVSNGRSDDRATGPANGNTGTTDTGGTHSGRSGDDGRTGNAEAAAKDRRGSNGRPRRYKRDEAGTNVRPLRGGKGAGSGDKGAIAPANSSTSVDTHEWLKPNPEILKRIRSQGRRRHATMLSFLLAVILPTIVIGLYYAVIASDQYVVSSQYSVRGANSSPLSDFGLSVIPGATTQSGDSYVVVGYIDSRQVVRDIMEQKGVDLRQFYSKPDIDFLYRIDPDMSLEEFELYWQDMVAVEFNSTTGNSTVQVTAFAPEDAQQISQLILDVSQKLVNDLSAESRRQMISVAQAEVERAEERLSAVRGELTALRNREQISDPSQLATIENTLVSEMEKRLADLKVRRRALVQTVSADSPSARVIDREISALQIQLDEQRRRIGSGSSETRTEDNGRLSNVISEFTDLTVDQEFATTAYTTALGALEKAIAEARQQQRYFATFVFPYTPDATIYPQRILMTLLAFGFLSLIWIVVYYIVRSIYDHAI